MQNSATSKKVSKKTTKKTASKPTKRIPKKSAKKPAARVSKKATPQSSKKVPGAPAQMPSKTTSQEPSKKSTRKSNNKPILVPVDFSAHAAAALKHAALVAECTQSPIAVLHVVHDPGDAPGYYQVKGRKKQLRRLEDTASEMLDNFMDKIVKRHPKDPSLKQAKRLLVTGLPVTRILEVANKLKPSMVVMGSKGRTGLSRLLLGSKAEQIVRLSPYSVTIVKLPESKG